MGGFYTNYEAATRYDFDLPVDVAEYERLRRPLTPFLEPQGTTVQRLDAALIETLVARGELPSEAEARQHRRDQAQGRVRNAAGVPASPFGPVAVPLPPLLPEKLRRDEPVQARQPAKPEEQERLPVAQRPIGVLIWQKTLPQTDALQVNEGSHHVGGVRLTQARFENPQGQRIDQTTYFRRVFANYPWEIEPGRHEDQEHAFVPMRIFIRGGDYGIRNFEISHKPSGEAGQDNYTTILRWGREFTPTVLQEKLTGTVFALYEIAEDNADFLIEITGA